MAEYDNKLSGALFKNDKGDNEKRPDYTGNYTHSDGNEFRVSAWVKKDKNGNSFMSFKMQEKTDPSKAAPAPVQDTSSDFLPF